jgi:hypothetical protein
VEFGLANRVALPTSFFFWRNFSVFERPEVCAKNILCKVAIICDNPGGRLLLQRKLMT